VVLCAAASASSNNALPAAVHAISSTVQPHAVLLHKTTSVTVVSCILS